MRSKERGRVKKKKTVFHFGRQRPATIFPLARDSRVATGGTKKKKKKKKKKEETQPVKSVSVWTTFAFDFFNSFALSHVRSTRATETPFTRSSTGYFRFSYYMCIVTSNRKRLPGHGFLCARGKTSNKREIDGTLACIYIYIYIFFFYIFI